MIPGPLNDDRFRMVEDEFLQTAQRFTAHLHHAEYSRLKTLAKTQNAATIRALERPVVGLLTNTARRTQEAAKRNSKQRKVQQSAGDDADADAPWMGTSLQGLMESPSKQNKALTSYTAGAARTKAAAGLMPGRSTPSNPRLDAQKPSRRRARSETPESTSDIEDEPDILPPPPRSTTANTPVMQSGPRSCTWPSEPSSTPRSSSRSFPISTKKSSHTTRRDQRSEPSARRDEDADENEGDDDPFDLSKRRIRREKSREQLRKSEGSSSKKATPDTMPSFL